METFYTSNQGYSPEQYWRIQLAQYNRDNFKVETPQLNQFAQYNPLQDVMPNYAQQFRDQTQPGVQSINSQTGLMLQGSSDPAAQLLGKQLAEYNLNTQPSSGSQPDVSHLTGANIDYGQQFMQVGTQLAGQLASQIGGKGGQIVSSAVKAGSSIYNNIANIREINTAAKAGVKGLGKAKAGNISAIGGAVSDLASIFLPEKTEYDGPKGDITKTMDSVYDRVSDAAMSFGPIGMMVGGIMKGGKLLGGAMNAIGGGTDGMTTTDAILGSSFLNLTPIGLINGLGGKRSATLAKNEEAFETVGSSYTGSNWTIDDALQKSGKKYGLFSLGALRRANEDIFEARRQQNIITDIADQATDRFAIRNSMAAINGNRRALAMQGGYNQAAIQVGRKGMVIVKRAASQHKMQERRKTLDPFKYYLSTLPDDQRTITREQWESSGSPKNFGEAIASGIFSYGDNGWQKVEEFKEGGKLNNLSVLVEIDTYSIPEEVLNHAIIDEIDVEDMVEEFKDGGVLASTTIDEIGVEEFKEGNSLPKKSRTIDELIEYAKQKNPRFIQRMSEPIKYVDLENGLKGTHLLSWGHTDNPDEAVVYPLIFENENGELVYDPEHAFENAKKGDSLLMTPEEAEIFTTQYKKGWPQFFNKFKEGGAFNVIPEGALHARLHHMDNAENLTKKGIPVVSEKDGELEQHAEIEREEIILRLSLTKRLEELAKEDTDEAALEAGKILVEEILNNTVDNTNKLL